MTVWIIISFGLIGVSLVYLWVVQARLDRMKERTDKIEQDLKKRRLTYKKAKANVLRQMQAEKKAKVVLSKSEREDFELFKKLLFDVGYINYDDTLYEVCGENQAREYSSGKVYEIDEKFWREINKC